jgi:hypothetical protein
VKRKELARGRKWLAATTKKSARRALGTQEGPRNTSFLESKGNRNEMARGQKVVVCHNEECQKGTGHPGGSKKYKFLGSKVK